MKILAVDDDPIILELLTEIFTLIGECEVVTAESGAQALEVVRNDPGIECFLLDIQMPDMDGIALCKALRAIPWYQRTPVLMLTAMSEKRYIDAAFAAGASDYINKPFEISELRGRIAMVRQMANQAAEAAQAVATRDAAEPEALPIVTQRPTTQPKSRVEMLRGPFPIRDIDGVIEEYALENYISNLTRKKLFGSSVFAFAIRRVDELYGALSTFDFQCLIVDVAEALADCMQGHQFLMSYLGNGVYGCVTEDGWTPDTERFVNDVQLVLHHMDLHSSDGRALKVRLATGKASRLVWRSGGGAVNALAEVCESAEREADRLERELDRFWYMEQSA